MLGTASTKLDSTSDKDEGGVGKGLRRTGGCLLAAFYTGSARAFLLILVSHERDGIIREREEDETICIAGSAAWGRPPPLQFFTAAAWGNARTAWAKLTAVGYSCVSGKRCELRDDIVGTRPESAVKRRDRAPRGSCETGCKGLEIPFRAGETREFIGASAREDG